jgi:hypothetical protein
MLLERSDISTSLFCYTALLGYILKEHRAMSFFNTHVKCALCNRSLTVWNINTCTKCGKKMCGHHTHFPRNPHSFVLSSVCYDCADRPETFSHPGFSSQQIKHSARTEEQTRSCSYAFPKIKAAIKTSAPPPTTCEIERNQFVPK